MFNYHQRKYDDTTRCQSPGGFDDDDDDDDPPMSIRPIF
jgi:hypothetical protein